MQIEASRRGYAFAVVRPSGDRNFDAHTVSVVFNVDEGPRAYIERINIRGNTRTRDYVIRREFDISEGDAYNRALVDRAERRLKNLDYFKNVKITTEPGSSQRPRDPDRRPGGEVDRRFLGVGRLLHDRRRPRRSLGLRAQPARRGLYAKASVSYGQYCARHIAVLRRALSARLPARAGLRHLLSPADCRTAIRAMA